MPSALSDHERQCIIALLPSGRSCRSIAREVGHSPSTVSAIAKSVGHEFGRANLVRALEARQSYGAEWRAEFAKRLSQDVEYVRGRLCDPYAVYAFSGKDGLFSSENLAEPDARALKDFFNAIGQGVKTILDIDRHDSAVGGLTDVQEYLTLQKGERPE